MSDDVSAVRSSFLSALSELRRDQFVALSNLDDILSGLLRSSQAAWPEVSVADDLFAGYLAKRIPEEDEREPGLVLASMQVQDLYLVYAGLQGDDQAIATLYEQADSAIHAALSRLALSQERKEDFKQDLCERLLYGQADRPPLLYEYSGWGNVAGWIRVVAIRDARYQVGREREVPFDQGLLASLPTPPDDPELDYLRTHYSEAFEMAFKQAITSLEQRQRNILRHHLLDGLSVDKLGVLYRVHRSTAARWVAGARKVLLEKLRSLLMQELNISITECNSIIRLVQSQLDLTLETFFRRPAEKRR